VSGLLLIDKPEGPTSAEVVRRVSRLLPGSKVGHLGTLDPFASGVLPLCVGEATKIAQFLNVADKEYEGIIHLGVSTDTGDCTGKTVRTAEVPKLTKQRLREAEDRFTGEYEQVPPMYSALKHKGVPLYRLARKGIEVERTPRRVHVTSLQLTAEGADRLRFKASCSKGTYIRVLAEDLGGFLGTAAHLESLRRTRFGRFDLAQAVPLSSWSRGKAEGWVTIREALSTFPVLELSADETKAVGRGQAWVLGRLDALSEADLAVLVDPEDRVVAVVSKRKGRWAFGRVLRPEGDSLQGSIGVLSN